MLRGPRSASPPRGGWRDYRLAIWMLYIGIAVAVLISPWIISVFFYGGALGIAVRVTQSRRRQGD
jgi:hypothetical protein